MTLRKLFTIIMCFALIITPNFMANAAIEGPDGDGTLTAVLYAACVAGCWAVGLLVAETTTVACIRKDCIERSKTGKENRCKA